MNTNDMNIWKYPTDKNILNIDLRGIFLGNYIHWEANKHGPLVEAKYNFEMSNEEFDRTYRKND